MSGPPPGYSEVFIGERADVGVECAAHCGHRVKMTPKALSVVAAGGHVCCQPCAARLQRKHPKAWIRAESTN